MDLLFHLNLIINPANGNFHKYNRTSPDALEEKFRRAGDLSPTFLRRAGSALYADGAVSVAVPAGCALGEAAAAVPLCAAASAVFASFAFFATLCLCLRSASRTVLASCDACHSLNFCAMAGSSSPFFNKYHLYHNPDLRSRLRTVSLGVAPRFSHLNAFCSSNLISAGFLSGL